MNTTNYYSNNSKSPKLKVIIIEIILLHSIQGFGVRDIDELKRIIVSSIHLSSLTSHTLKKYLHYLIEYDLIFYDGINHVFVMKERGFKLLYTICNSRKKYSLDIEKLLIVFE